MRCVLLALGGPLGIPCTESGSCSGVATASRTSPGSWSWDSAVSGTSEIELRRSKSSSLTYFGKYVGGPIELLKGLQYC